MAQKKLFKCEDCGMEWEKESAVEDSKDRRRDGCWGGFRSNDSTKISLSIPIIDKEKKKDLGILSIKEVVTIHAETEKGQHLCPLCFANALQRALRLSRRLARQIQPMAFMQKRVIKGQNSIAKRVFK